MKPIDITTTARLAALASGLEAAGWCLLDFDLDLSRGTARLELRRTDGLNVTFDARNGAASLTREVMEMATVRIGRRGDVFRAERLRPRFVGRDSGMGVRQGLRVLCAYLADNAVTPLPAGAVRHLLRPLMDGASHALPRAL